MATKPLIAVIGADGFVGGGMAERFGATRIVDGPPPNPSTFPSPAYATAKLEADEYLKSEAAKRGFRLMFLRPAVVYSPQGAGMVGPVLKLAKQGVTLR